VRRSGWNRTDTLIELLRLEQRQFLVATFKGLAGSYESLVPRYSDPLVKKLFNPTSGTDTICFNVDLFRAVPDGEPVVPNDQFLRKFSLLASIIEIPSKAAQLAICRQTML
jgi:hypothetical protein